MKLIDTISWLMGGVQRSLFPHLNHCLPAPLTEQEKRLVAILEIAKVERQLSRHITNFRYPGRNPLDRQALAGAFVAKAFYRLATTSDLRRALLSAVNLPRICGFVTDEDVAGVFSLTDAARTRSGSCHAYTSSRITMSTG